MEPHESLVVALLPKPEDLNRARAGWYRVPLVHAPDSLARARGIALYQPASFGEARWQVAWWARIRAAETLRRRDLIPDEPSHRRADQWYLCLRLEPLQPVEPPKVATKGRRLLFVPTTWAAFQAAPTLDELVASAPRPVGDNPLYGLIQQQIAGQAGIPDPGAPHQRRLFEPYQAEYDELDW